MMTRKYVSRPHIGWRPSVELNERWIKFLKTQPPTNRSEYLNQMLTYYLDQADQYGLDPITLRPKSPRRK